MKGEGIFFDIKNCFSPLFFLCDAHIIRARAKRFVCNEAHFHTRSSIYALCRVRNVIVNKGVDPHIIRRTKC